MKNLIVLIFSVAYLSSFAQLDAQLLEIINSEYKNLNKEFPLETLVTYEGKTINLFNSNEKLYVINFWFRGCKPCIAEMPALNQLKKDYSQYKIEFISVSFDDKEDFDDILKNNSFDFRHCHLDREIIEKNRLTKGYPTTLILDKDGIIRFQKSGGPTDGVGAMEIYYKLSDELDKLKPVIN